MWVLVFRKRMSWEIEAENMLKNMSCFLEVFAVAAATVFFFLHNNYLLRFLNFTKVYQCHSSSGIHCCWNVWAFQSRIGTRVHFALSLCFGDLIFIWALEFYCIVRIHWVSLDRETFIELHGNGNNKYNWSYPFDSMRSQRAYME